MPHLKGVLNGKGSSTVKDELDKDISRQLRLMPYQALSIKGRMEEEGLISIVCTLPTIPLAIMFISRVISSTLTFEKNRRTEELCPARATTLKEMKQSLSKGGRSVNIPTGQKRT